MIARTSGDMYNRRSAEYGRAIAVCAVRLGGYQFRKEWGGEGSSIGVGHGGRDRWWWWWWWWW